ncbi:MAG: alpha/beta fold hydrolase [Acidimicrobiales bacterium]
MARTERIVVDGLGRLPQFSHAAVAGGLVFVSGTLGTSEGFHLVEGGAGPQTTQTMANIETILGTAGATWDDVVKLSVYLADMADGPAMNAAYEAFFPGGEPPARITVGGADLALGARVEIDAVARLPHRDQEVDATLRRRTGFLDHDGESIYYEVVGEGDATLVLSHGAGGNHAVWYQQVASFARERTVVTWDHRGYGRSTDRAGRSGPAVAVGDLLALLDHLDITTADLVGQSMGGWTVVGTALSRPELPRRIVLADTLGGFTSAAIEAALADRPPLDLSEDLGLHPALDPSFSARRPEEAHLYQSLGRMGTADPAVLLPRLVAATHDETEAAQLTAPVLCVVGDRDPLFPPAAVRALADLLPDARVAEITGSGHSPYYEDPAMWNAVVRHFLDHPA